MRAISRIFEALRFLPAMFLAGCAGPTFTPDAAPEYLVIHARTPFYRLGPQQAGPPDARLAVDDRVRLLRREFGYSLTRIPSGETGYVANEDLKPAPPEVSSASTPEAAPRESPDRAAPVAPVVEAPLPDPDLQAPPADAPAL